MVYHKYTPGNSLIKAVQLVKEFNRNNIACSLSFLPVKKEDENKIREEVLEYKKLIKKIKEEGLNCDITLKLHQFGIYGNKAFCEQCILEVAEYAKYNGVFVWIDMELPDTVSTTIEIFKRINKKHKNTGIAMQANLKRTEHDMKELLKDRVPMRLVKGFYKANDFSTWQEVTDNYSKLMEYLLSHSTRPCIATHDLALIEKAKEIISKNKINDAELQFFNGVRNDLAQNLSEEGFKTRIYIPYGRVWKFLLTGLNSFDIKRHLQRIMHLKVIR
jgi:proline dehydrogenase